MKALEYIKENSGEPVFYCVHASHDDSLSPPTQELKEAEIYAISKR